MEPYLKVVKLVFLTCTTCSGDISLDRSEVVIVEKLHRINTLIVGQRDTSLSLFLCHTHRECQVRSLQKNKALFQNDEIELYDLNTML